MYLHDCAAAREHVLAELSQGEITEAQFNDLGIKSVNDLSHDLALGEAVIRYNPRRYDPELDTYGMLDKYSTSVWIAVEAGHELTIEELREKGRVYKGKEDRPIWHHPWKPYAARETMNAKDHGDPRLAVERCLREEWGVLPDQYVWQPRVFVPTFLTRKDGVSLGVLSPDDQYARTKPIEVRSSVYYRTWSITRVHRFRLIMPEKRWPNGRKLKDNGNVTLYLEWSPVLGLLPSTGK